MVRRACFSLILGVLLAASGLRLRPGPGLSQAAQAEGAGSLRR